MSKKIFIDTSSKEETRIALTLNGRLDDFEIETNKKVAVKSDIFLAKISRVEPSLQAAFVDYGANRHGFLPLTEIHPDYFKIPISDQTLLKKLSSDIKNNEIGDDNGDIDSSGSAPQYMYKTGGIYDVELTIIANNGCPNKIIKQIEIFTDPVLDVAMAFTPNSDGTNDILYPLTLGFNTENPENKFVFRIYNRWGTMLFESSDTKQGWDGSYKGAEQPIGIYVYYMHVLTTDGEEFNKKGDITLFR